MRISPVLLIVVLAVGAWFTNPTLVQHQQQVEAEFSLIRKQALTTGTLSGLLAFSVVDLLKGGQYDNYLVASRYRVLLGSDPFFECFGALNHIYCKAIEIKVK